MVGRRYEEGQYFISGLIMGGGILKRTVQLVKPGLEVFYSEHPLGVIVLGTVEDDIHDIGKSIVNTLLCCQGFKVVDLGVDVAPEAFVQAVIEHKPKVLGLSCLLTTAFDSLKRTILAIETAGLRHRMPILIGGGQLDQSICEYVGADHWTGDAVEGVDWCIRSANAS